MSNKENTDKGGREDDSSNKSLDENRFSCNGTVGHGSLYNYVDEEDDCWRTSLKLARTGLLLNKNVQIRTGLLLNKNVQIRSMEEPQPAMKKTGGLWW